MALTKIKHKDTGEVKFFINLWSVQKFCSQSENASQWIILGKI